MPAARARHRRQLLLLRQRPPDHRARTRRPARRTSAGLAALPRLATSPPRPLCRRSQIAVSIKSRNAQDPVLILVTGLIGGSATVASLPARADDTFQFQDLSPQRRYCARGPTPAVELPPGGWRASWLSAATWTGRCRCCGPGPTPETGRPPRSWPACWVSAATWTGARADAGDKEAAAGFQRVELELRVLVPCRDAGVRPHVPGHREGLRAASGRGAVRKRLLSRTR
jgi:hypothetical protein